MTHTWLEECFAAQSHTYPVFTCKVSTLTQFTLELGCKNYSFLDQAVKDFEHGLDSILTDSVDALYLDASFNQADAMPSLVSSGFYA